MSEDLKALPIKHPLRNEALSKVKAEYRFEGTKTWFAVKPTFGIAGKTFNELGEAWINKWEWRA